jgi:hypothetical protein
MSQCLLIVWIPYWVCKQTSKKKKKKTVNPIRVSTEYGSISHVSSYLTVRNFDWLLWTETRVNWCDQHKGKRWDWLKGFFLPVGTMRIYSRMGPCGPFCFCQQLATLSLKYFTIKNLEATIDELLKFHVRKKSSQDEDGLVQDRSSRLLQ